MLRHRVWCVNLVNQRKTFWDKKILGWEQDKYSPRTLLDPNASVKARRRIAAGLISRFAQTKSVIDLGCGSGTLLEAISGVKLKSYIGIDISPLAIERAKERAAGLSCAFPVNFQVGELKEVLETLDGDFVVSLGLTDWLSAEELKLLLRWSENRTFLHSFTHSKAGLKKFLHSAYVHLLYGHKDPSYVPQYYREEELLEILEKPAGILSPEEMGIGRFIHNLPLERP